MSFIETQLCTDEIRWLVWAHARDVMNRAREHSFQDLPHQSEELNEVLDRLNYFAEQLTKVVVSGKD